MSAESARKAAYRFVAQAIHRSLDYVPWVNDPDWRIIRPEVERIEDSMRSAGAMPLTSGGRNGVKR